MLQAQARLRSGRQRACWRDRVRWSSPQRQIQLWQPSVPLCLAVASRPVRGQGARLLRGSGTARPLCVRPWIGRARRRGQHGLRGGLLDASEMSAVGDVQYMWLIAGNNGESDLQPWRWACGGLRRWWLLVKKERVPSAHAGSEFLGPNHVRRCPRERPGRPRGTRRTLSRTLRRLRARRSCPPRSVSPFGCAMLHGAYTP